MAGPQGFFAPPAPDATKPLTPTPQPAAPAGGSFFGPSPQDPLGTALTTAKATTPDQAARLHTLSEKTGLPPEVLADHVDEVEAQVNAAGFDPAAFRAKSPLLSTWLQAHPVNAAVAQGDLVPLTGVETALRRARYLGGSLAAGVAGFSAGTWRAIQALAELPVGDLPGATSKAGQAPAFPALVEPARLSAAIAEGYQNRLRGDQVGTSRVERAVYSGVESIGQMAPAMALGLLLGPEALLGAAGVTTGGQAYGDAREQGVDVTHAWRYAALQGTIEVATEYIPAHRLLKDLTEHSGLILTLAHQLVPEVVGEEVATALQDLNDWANLPSHKADTFQDYLDARPGAAVDTLIATLVATGVQTGAVHTAMRLTRGQATKAIVEDVGTAAGEAKIAAIAPGKFEDFIQSSVAGTPSETVYAPIDTWDAYWKSLDEDPAARAATLTGDPSAHATAQASGGLLAIPFARYASQLAGSQHNAFFADELKFHPLDMNARETAAFEAQQQVEADAAAVAAGAPTADEQIHAQLTEQLVAQGEDPAHAATQATFVQHAFGSMATAAGEDPAAIYAEMGLTVTAPSQVAATAAGTTTTHEQPGTPAVPPEVGGTTPQVTGGALPGGTVGRLRALGLSEAEIDGLDAEKANALLKERGETTGTEEHPLDPDAPINVMEDIGAAAARMMAENPNLVAEAEALRAQAMATRRTIDILEEEGAPPVDELTAPRFLGWSESGVEGVPPVALYQVGRDTWDAAQLVEHGLPVPATPAPPSPLRQATRTLFQTQETLPGMGPVPAFYSRLTAAVEQSKQTKATGKDWKAIIRAAKVKEDEFALTRTGDLDDATKYTKGEVLAYLNQRAIVIVPVVFGGSIEGETDILADARPGLAAISEAQIAAQLDPLQPPLIIADEEGFVPDEEPVLEEPDDDEVQERTDELVDAARDDARDNVDMDDIIGTATYNEETIENEVEHEREVEVLDDNGDPVLDDNGDPVTETETYVETEEETIYYPAVSGGHRPLTGTDRNGNRRYGVVERGGDETIEEFADDGNYFDNHRDATRAAQTWLNNLDLEPYYELIDEAVDNLVDYDDLRSDAVTEIEERLQAEFDEAHAEWEENNTPGFHPRPRPFPSLPEPPPAREPIPGQTVIASSREAFGNEEYKVPGYLPGTAREVFVTAPNLPAGPLPAETATLTVVPSAEGNGWFVLQDETGALVERYGATLTYDTAEDAEAAREGQIASWSRKRRAAADTSPKWVDGHGSYADVKNPIVRLRWDERVTTDGRRVLFLEEVQPPTEGENFDAMPPLFQKNWKEIGFTWALHYAAEHGFDAVGWTPGAIQRARYNLSQAVNQITWSQDPERQTGFEFTDDAGVEHKATRVVTVNLRSGGQITLYVSDDGIVVDIEGDAGRIRDQARGFAIKKVLGPEIQGVIMGSPRGALEDEGLTIGGVGLANQYDKTFPKVVEGLPAIKKLQGRIGTADIPVTDPRGRPDTREVYGLGTLPIPVLTITPEMRRALLGGLTLYQPGEELPPRASITFTNDLAKPGRRTATIGLFADKNLSSFLHEGGHLFLELMGDLVEKVNARDPATLTLEQQRLVHDYTVLLTALGVEGRDQITDAHHEQVANWLLQYLREGKAPSLELRSAFARARAWLLDLYKDLTSLGAPLTAEVRGVFNRMLATEAAIAEAETAAHIEPLFLTAEQAGKTPAEFQLYRTVIEDASRKAREELDAQAQAEVTREQTGLWKQQRREIETVVRDELEGQPVYQALAAIRTGLRADGSPLNPDAPAVPMKLSRQLAAAQTSDVRVRTLPRDLFSREDGLDPNLVAEMFGFAGAAGLFDAIKAAVPITVAIKQETDRRMIAAHGSLLLDGTLQEKAQAAVANDYREQVVREELRALTALARTVAPFVKLERQAGAAALKAEEAERAYERRWFAAETKLRIAIAQGKAQAEIDTLSDAVSALRQQTRSGAAVIRRGVPSATAVRDAAVTRIQGTKVRDLRPVQHWAAARQASMVATAAAAKQDFPAAITAKTQELMALALFREASRAKLDVEARVAKARSFATKPVQQRLGLAGSTFLGQVLGILDRWDFAKVSLKQLDRRARIKDWIEAMNAEGLPAGDFPQEVLDDARRINFQEATVAELVGITDGLDQLVHLAQERRGLLTEAKDVLYRGVRDGIETSIRANNPAHPLPLEFRPKDAKRRTATDWLVSHKKIAFLARALDGGVEGPIWHAIVRKLNAAADAKQARRTAEGKKYWAILNRHYPGRELATLNQKLAIPAIGASLSKEGRLAVALNWGTQEGRDRLLADPSRQWTEPQVRAILDTLDARDWAFVQDTWDFNESFWPEIKAKQERVTGLAPVKTTALPVETKFGTTLRGGYYHLEYDGRLSPRAEQHAAATAAKMATSNAYGHQTTQRGYLQARVQNVKLAVKLDLSVQLGHIDQVIHDLTHHETLIDVTRLLRDPAVQRAIYETRGDLVYQQFTRALEDIAIGSLPPAKNVLDKAANFVRGGTQIAGLGWNLWTAAQQPLGLFNGASEIGPTWVMHGLVRWLRDPRTMADTVRWITENSTFMADRALTGSQDLNDLRTSLAKPGGWFDSLVRKVSNDLTTQQAILDSFLWHIALMQRVADIPTWLGAHAKALDANPDDTALAIALADQAVRNSQGSSQIHDLAQIQRGGPVARMFMTFYSYGNLTLNQALDKADRVKGATDVGTFLGHLGLIYVFPAIATIALATAFGRRGGDDDDWTTFFEEVGAEAAGSALNGIVLARELGGLLRPGGTRGYEGPAGARALALAYQLGGQIKQGVLDSGLWHAANSVGGVLFRYPAGQVARTVDGYVALHEGRTHNPLALLFGPPPKKASGQ